MMERMAKKTAKRLPNAVTPKTHPNTNGKTSDTVAICRYPQISRKRHLMPSAFATKRRRHPIVRCACLVAAKSPHTKNTHRHCTLTENHSPFNHPFRPVNCRKAVLVSQAGAGPFPLNRSRMSDWTVLRLSPAGVRAPGLI